MSAVARRLAIVTTVFIIGTQFAVAPVAAGPVNASISTVDITPTRALTDEPVTVSATVRNLRSSTSDLSIDSVLIRRTTDAAPLDRVRDLGSLSPGTDLVIPLQTAFDGTGMHSLRVLVNGTSELGRHINLTYPVSVIVRDRHPELTIDVEHSIAGIESTAVVTVANGFNRALRNLRVSLTGLSEEPLQQVRSRLPSGDTAAVTFSPTPASSGPRTVTATVEYLLGDGRERWTTTESTVIVRDPGRPRLTIDVDRPIAGVETTATVTVANGLDRPVQDVEIRLDGVPTANARRVIPAIAVGESAAFTYDVTPTDAGPTDVTATITYRFDAGEARTTATRSTVDVEALSERVTLDAVAREGRVEVTVSNLGNAPLTGLIVNGSAATARVGQATVAELAPGAAVTVTVPVTGLTPSETATVRIAARYGVGGDPAPDGQTAVETVIYESTPPAEITLTGIVVEPTVDDRLRISGSASNVGLGDAHSVIVRVLPTAGVRPAEPNREYFAGTVPGSDFVSFDVFARAETNVSTLPLAVSYLAEGATRSNRMSVPLDPVDHERQPVKRAGLPSSAIVGTVVVGFAAIVVIVVGWRAA